MLAPSRIPLSLHPGYEEPSRGIFMVSEVAEMQASRVLLLEYRLRI